MAEIDPATSAVRIIVSGTENAMESDPTPLTLTMCDDVQRVRLELPSGTALYTDLTALQHMVRWAEYNAQFPDGSEERSQEIRRYHGLSGG